MKKIIGSIPQLVNLKILWLYLYLLKVIFALLMIFPIFMVLNTTIASSSMAAKILAGWDMSIIVEIILSKGVTVLPLAISVLSMLVVYLILMQFLNGGLYYLTVSGQTKKIIWREFFAECGTNFAKHLKITMLMGAVYALILPASVFLANLIGSYGDTFIGAGVSLFFMIKIGIVALMMMAASTFSDSARASVAAYPDLPIKEILSKTAEFFRPRLFKLSFYFLVTYIPFFIVWWLVEMLSMKTASAFPGLIALFIEFILFQIAALTRTGQKLWYLINVGNLYRSVSPGRFQPVQIELPLK